MRPESLPDLARRTAAEVIPPAVLRAVTEHYDADETARILRTIHGLHRERWAQYRFTQERAAGVTVDDAIRTVAAEVYRSEGWVRGVVYPGQRRS